MKSKIKLILSFAKKQWFLFIAAEICILGSYVIALLLPIYLRNLIDKVLFARNYNLLYDIIVKYLVLFLVASCFNFFYMYVWQMLNDRYVVKIRTSAFEKVIRAPAAFLSGMNSGDVMSRLDLDSDQFLHIIQRNLFHFVNSILLCGGIVFFIASMNWIIAIIVVIAAVLPIITTRLLRKLTEIFAKSEREISGKLDGLLFECLKGLREIKLFCAEQWAKNKIFVSLKKIVILGNKLRYVDFAANKITYLINISASIFIYGFSAYLIINGEITIGTFLAIIEYLALLHKKFNWMLRIYLDLHGRKVSVDRVNEILNSGEEQSGEIEIETAESIEFQNVSFGYSDLLVLDNVSFKIEKGERVAFIGESGAGKSTIVLLILGFYTPIQGKIFINGIELKSYRIESLRKAFRTVSQDVFLFEDSIRNNITMFEDIQDESVMRALDKAGIEEIADLNIDKLDAIISYRESDLSVGQKQRIMFSRLFLRDKGTIILDEATSSLDSKTEEKVLKNLFSEFSDDTIIVISHRLSCVKNCGKIFVLDNGKIEDAGAYDNYLKHLQNAAL